MLKIFESFEFLGKCLLIRVRNLRPTFVETFWLYGGLNQVIQQLATNFRQRDCEAAGGPWDAHTWSARYCGWKKPQAGAVDPPTHHHRNRPPLDAFPWCPWIFHQPQDLADQSRSSRALAIALSKVRWKLLYFDDGSSVFSFRCCFSGPRETLSSHKNRCQLELCRISVWHLQMQSHRSIYQWGAG